VPNYAASGTVGRFYPHRYVLTNADPISTCSINPSVVPTQQFHYMGRIFNAENIDPTTVGLQFTLSAVDASGSPVSNYDPDYKGDGNTTINDAYGVAVADFAAFTAAQNLDARLVNNAGIKLAPGTWVKGVMNVNQPQAQFGRLPTPDGPYANLKVGLAIKDCLDKRLLASANLTLDTTNSCGAPNNNAYELARFDARYGRLVLGDAFGPESANLPVNFHTEHWIGNRFVRNLNDNCTGILRSNVLYPNGNILTSANLTVDLNGGNTAGTYGSMGLTEITFSSGDAQHFFTAPTGAATGNFNVSINLTSYPWLRFDWNQDATFPTDANCSLPASNPARDSDCNLNARFGFGSYRGHDRVIYWREKF
jgi:MSHA biogenesis protein MshQ